MICFGRQRRAYRAAVDTLAPLVAHTRARLPALPDGFFLEPYAVGHLGLLIALVATRAVGPLGSDRLASVQTRAWRRLSAVEDDLIGSDIIGLSLSSHPAFSAGCADAVSVFEALTGTSVDPLLSAGGDWVRIVAQVAEAGPAGGGADALADALAVWEATFEAAAETHLAACRVGGGR
ncbi:hypothetical protein [Chthonobacter rhizosphaerae]|uniref:hypothetical protein n=1 Tax=Chthonobacter rhizosphaerae TaxID=2735553 RepID=UPI0015EFC6D6|nr:hypothetical protein [Chthonobacter rhizosphaerae]